MPIMIYNLVDLDVTYAAVNDVTPKDTEFFQLHASKN